MNIAGGWIIFAALAVTIGAQNTRKFLFKKKKKPINNYRFNINSERFYIKVQEILFFYLKNFFITFNKKLKGIFVEIIIIIKLTGLLRRGLAIP